MTDDVSVILFVLWWVWILWDFVSGITTPRKELIRRQRIKNTKRGIIMQPGWKYRQPDGTVVMSKTGRVEDMRFLVKGPEWQKALWTDADQEKAVKE